MWILPAKTVTRVFKNGTKVVSTATTAFPSLAAPNAAAEVYDQYIGDAKWFRDITIASVETKDDKIKTYKFTIDVLLKRVAKGADSYQLIIETKLKSREDLATFDSESLEAKDFLLLKGFTPTLTYTIDFSKRTTNRLDFEMIHNFRTRKSLMMNYILK